jgi:putative transposase
MSSIKAFRFQLRLQPAQQRQLQRWSGQLRWIWNHALAEQRARHARGEKYAGHGEMCKWLTAWRNDAATAWLASGPVHPQQQVLKRLDEAYKRFFAKTGGLPKFKRYGLEPGIRFPDPKQFELDAANGRLKLPKLSWVRLRQSRLVTGALRNLTLRREGERWFVSMQTLGNEVAQSVDLPLTLGIDLGVSAFAATSAGALIAPLNALKAQQVRLRRYQKAVSRKLKGSCNRKKAVQRLGALHRRIARQRNDWLHKLSTQIVSEHPVLAIEDLKVKGMSASARGNAAAPGKGVKAKAGLNRSILDQGWSEFRRQLQYKTAAVGGSIVAVPAACTSQRCSACGHTAPENRKSQSAFRCMACGHALNADVNAAKNILAAGHAATAHAGALRPAQRASAVQAAPSKWEPTEAATHEATHA